MCWKSFKVFQIYLDGAGAVVGLAVDGFSVCNTEDSDFFLGPFGNKDVHLKSLPQRLLT